jgi:hypothetical protein
VTMIPALARFGAQPRRRSACGATAAAASIGARPRWPAVSASRRRLGPAPAAPRYGRSQPRTQSAIFAASMRAACSSVGA